MKLPWTRRDMKPFRTCKTFEEFLIKLTQGHRDVGEMSAEHEAKNHYDRAVKHSERTDMQWVDAEPDIQSLVRSYNRVFKTVNKGEEFLVLTRKKGFLLGFDRNLEKVSNIFKHNFPTFNIQELNDLFTRAESYYAGYIVKYAGMRLEFSMAVKGRYGLAAYSHITKPHIVSWIQHPLVDFMETEPPAK
ncbi:hypothetical protein [Chitinophaga sp. Ak27]|uniref:hypothetical protein n=1 Tax=Chitinophaga sp. Ak27 TaxID=2726116 RepID=UPI00145E0297|nr:hypothetical protein [Chitinophaga sp. Ak27]NLU94900.1 hypothetical protein [Chitinophaga sp. Ak27]